MENKMLCGRGMENKILCGRGMENKMLCGREIMYRWDWIILQGKGKSKQQGSCNVRCSMKTW